MTSVLSILLFVAMMATSVNGFGATKLVYQYNWDGSATLDEGFMALIEQFKKEHPEIDLEIVRGGGADRVDKLAVAVAAGTVPDVVNFERSIAIEWANKGLLQPVDRIVSPELLNEEVWMPGAYSELFYNGRLYGVPFDTGIRGLFWNKDMVAEGGFDPGRAPATMAELDDMAQKLTRMDGEGAYTQVGFIPWLGNWYGVGWLYTFGGDIYDPTTHQPVVNSPDHIRAFEWIQSYGQRYPHAQVSASGINTNSFLQGKMALVAHANILLEQIARAEGEINYGIGEVPHPDYGQNGTWMGGYAHVVPTGARNLEGAKVLLEWLAKQENQANWWRWAKRFPTHMGAIQAVRDEMDEEHAILAQQTDVAFGRPPLWFPPMYRTTTDAMIRVARLEQDPKTALDEAQRALEIDFAAVFGE